MVFNGPEDKLISELNERQNPKRDIVAGQKSRADLKTSKTS